MQDRIIPFFNSFNNLFRSNASHLICKIMPILKKSILNDQIYYSVCKLIILSIARWHTLQKSFAELSFILQLS